MDDQYAFNNNNQVYFNNVSITESTEYTLTTGINTGIVDSYMVFEGANKTKAELYNVSIVDDMTVKPSAEAAGQSMTATLYMLDVTGKVAKASVNLKFAGTTVETPAEAPASTFNVTDVQDATNGLDAQTVYIDVTGMFSATEALNLNRYAISVEGLNDIFTAKTSAGAAASIGLTRALYQSDKETVFNPTVDDVSKLKWLAITVDARESEDLLFYNSTVEAKAYELTTTVSSNGNELRKFKSKLNVVVPAFDDLFATVGGGLWNSNTYTATITGSGTPQVAFDNAFTAKTNDYPKTGLTLTSLKAGNNNAYTGSLAIGGTILTTGDNKVISNNAINIKTLSAKVEYKFGGKLTASKSFNVNLRSIFEGIDLKYYVNGVAQVSDYTVSLTADNKISGLSFNNSKPVTGLGVEFNNDLKALNSDLNGASGSLAGISTYNEISVSVEGNDALTATLDNSGIQIAKSSGSINPGDGGTLVIKFTDSVGIIITEKVNFVK